ncbi:FAD binding domain-containing protein [Rhypophila decipiens]|uniref:FAD binding domain-containing protein n=1 Tax=Rhypophila decipiens TaxID=261697 RepID=A0AAN6YES2_9PEZI|nr:FAD binding domain-containing protein [Rhypophila decipiens]
MPNITETGFLVIGAGPAGASLACFLASHGLKGIVISVSLGTADTPRAHITNAAALECLRDIGLEEEAMRLGHDGEDLKHVRYCHSMAGDEFGRVYAFGNGPDFTQGYQLASPCKHIDLPQNLLEPMLIRYSTTHGFAVRYQTKLIEFVEETGGDSGYKTVTATVQDTVFGHEYQIRTKYLFGADGARSNVVKQLGIPLHSALNMDDSVMINVLVRADLTHLMRNRKGDLHLIFQPEHDEKNPDLKAMAILRMIKPWHEWMFLLVAKPGFDPRASNMPNEYFLPIVKQLIGDDTPADILHVAYWSINETVAEYYSNASHNVFILGDAAHRHSPGAGLGSNTCIQDAYNLAWKIAYVERGLASTALLDTYSAERQPVGRAVVKRANDAFRNGHPLFDLLGVVLTPDKANPEAVSQLASSTPSGAERRKRLREALRNVRGEFNGLGAEMGQLYANSMGIYTADETAPFALTGQAAEDPILYHQASTYPGRRLPHVWLNKAVPERPPISTIDLAGHGAFTLLTGHGGGAWKQAAQAVGKELGIEIRAYSIGFRLDWEDVYFDWADVCGVEESGVVLVRPDRFVAWRAKTVVDGGQTGCEGKLKEVMRSILGL